MSGPPSLLCPRCGRNLHRIADSTCPDCGYHLQMKRIQHRGAVRYWRFVRSRRRIEWICMAAWLAAAALGYRLFSFSPGGGFIVLAVVAGLGIVGLGKYLALGRKKTRGSR